DVSEAALRETALALLAEYPRLRVHAVAGDFEKSIDHIPPGARRLVLFIGGSIGNYTDPQAVRLLRRLRRCLHPDDHFLLGTDLVKSREELRAAYNDAAGITAAFNMNLLEVINRELGADFDLDRFEHIALYNEEASQIEMYLRSSRRQTVRIPALSMRVSFEPEECILTEISRKYTRESVEAILFRAGFRLKEWFTERDRFGTSLSTIA
ncbi:MAG: L-histidine N(alpha)-methyltransferase, partial [Vicinamibacteria bacterium]